MRFEGVMIASGNEPQQELSSAPAEASVRFQVLADSTPVMLWTTDAQGNIRFLNRACTQFLGRSEADVRRDGWKVFVHPDDAEHYAGAFFAALRERKPFRAQARVRRHDGEWRWIESYGAPKLSPSGEMLGIVGSSPDITERTQMEEALREADRRKDEALAIVAHELRNPLAAIRNAVQVLARTPTDNAQAGQARNIIERQVTQMSRLIADLLDVSAIRRGKVDLHEQRCDLTAIVRNAVEDVKPTVQARGLVLRCVPPPRPLWVRGDALRLGQVATNLLNNAAKFTDAGGTVAIELAPGEDAATAVLRVRDTGVGIEREVLPRIFDPFVQAGSATAGGRRGGLGLGLALVKGLVELHGGRVLAQSDGPGKGALFSVILPAEVTAGIETPAGAGA